jgi:hypothetical protein
MPLMLLLLVAALVAKFFWLLAGLAAAVIVGRLIGGWLAWRVGSGSVLLNQTDPLPACTANFHPAPTYGHCNTVWRA